MAQHYFTIDELELAKAMYNDRICIEMEGLGAFGEKTGDVISFDKDDAEFDAEFLREQFEDEYEKLSDEEKEDLDDHIISYYTASDLFSNLDNAYDLDNIVVFNKNIGQCTQNFLQWDRCIGEISCDEDDYDEFMEEHEEFQTKEWKIHKALKMLNEMGLTVEDLKENA